MAAEVAVEVARSAQSAAAAAAARGRGGRWEPGGRASFRRPRFVAASATSPTQTRAAAAAVGRGGCEGRGLFVELVGEEDREDPLAAILSREEAVVLEGKTKLRSVHYI